MIILIGAIIIFASVLGGFTISGGSVASLIHPSELLVIGGAAFGAMVIMAPKAVLIDLFKNALGALKGIPYSQKSYQELFLAMYELFMVGRKNGMIALEEHVNEPESSSIFSKYPSFVGNKEAIDFLCEGLRPVIDGRIKAEQLHSLFEVQLDKMEVEGHEPVDVLTKVGDALPGFGIVAAVLGIVITMGAISGPIEEIGHKVGTALVGTFLGIFMAYGFVNPLAMNMTFLHKSTLDFLRCISSAVVSFTTGMAPAMAIELSRRRVATSLRPNSEELEQMMKSIKPG